MKKRILDVLFFGLLAFAIAYVVTMGVARRFDRSIFTFELEDPIATVAIAESIEITRAAGQPYNLRLKLRKGASISNHRYGFVLHFIPEDARHLRDEDRARGYSKLDFEPDKSIASWTRPYEHDCEIRFRSRSNKRAIIRLGVWDYNENRLAGADLREYAFDFAQIDRDDGGAYIDKMRRESAALPVFLTVLIGAFLLIQTTAAAIDVRRRRARWRYAIHG